MRPQKDIWTFYRHAKQMMNLSGLLVDAQRFRASDVHLGLS